MVSSANSIFLSLLCLFLPGILCSIPLHPNRFEENQRENERLTSSSCTIDYLVQWLNIRDLAKLIVEWADKKNLEPNWVFEEISNSISMSEHVHRLPKGNSELLKSVGEDRRHHSHHQHRPLDFPIGVPRELALDLQSRAQPINFFQPAAHHMPPPSFMIRSQMTDVPMADMRAVLSPFLLEPPMDATVQIFDGDWSSPPASIKVTISPQMSVLDVLTTNPFKSGDYAISWSKSDNGECLFVRAIGNHKTSAQFAWEISVIDSSKQEIYRSVCVSQSDIEAPVRPDTSIILKFVPTK